MKIWTIQAPEVLAAILDKGVYYPDFSQSSTLRQVPAYSSLYNSVLESYNRMNCTKAKGLIFGFRKLANGIVDISTLDEFYGLLEENLDVIGDMLKDYRDQNAIILELEYKSLYLNPLHIDITDFQMLEYHEIENVFDPVNYKYLLRIKHNLVNGTPERSTSPVATNLMQVHIPYISKNNLRNVYKLSDFF